MKKLIILIILSCFFWHNINSKVLIITTAFNRPDFIEIQYKTFKKFLKDDYEYMVFSDANNPNMQEQIKEMCKKYNITHVLVPQNVHNVDHSCHKAPASFRHGEAMQFAFETIGFMHNDIVMLLDSDVFLIREFDVHNFMTDYDIYAIHDDMFGVNTPNASFAIRPQLSFINMPKLNKPHTINFRAAHIYGNFIDAGYLTSLYLKVHPELKLKRMQWFPSLYNDASCDLGLNRKDNIAKQLKSKNYTKQEMKLINEIVDLGNQNSNIVDCDIGFFETNTFLDYRHGSGWNGPLAHIIQKKDIIIKEFINSILN